MYGAYVVLVWFRLSLKARYIYLSFVGMKILHLEQEKMSVFKMRTNKGFIESFNPIGYSIFRLYLLRGGGGGGGLRGPDPRKA